MSNTAETGSRATLNDVELPLSVIIGNATLSLQDVAELQPDAVIALASRADEPLKISVNGKVIATGELCEGEDGPNSLAIRVLDVHQDGSDA